MTQTASYIASKMAPWRFCPAEDIMETINQIMLKAPMPADDSGLGAFAYAYVINYVSIAAKHILPSTY